MITVQDHTAAYLTPYVYNISRNKWSLLPNLPYGNASFMSIPDQNQLLAIGGCKKNDNDIVEVSRQVFQWDEVDKKWCSEYPTMPTARFSTSSISHGSVVIVAGGVTCSHPWTITRAVEILITKGPLSGFRPYWITVEKLPHAVYDAVSLIVNDSLYITGGFDEHCHNTCSIVTASIQGLQKSNSKDISASHDQMWHKLHDMPYFSYSISHYQGHLIAFTMDKKPDKDDHIQKVYLYNPDAESWDYVDQFTQRHNWGRSILIEDHLILVVGGTTGTAYKGEDNDLVKTCFTISLN